MTPRRTTSKHQRPYCASTTDHPPRSSSGLRDILEPVRLFGELGRKFHCAMDQGKLVVVPHSLERHRRSRTSEVDERDAAWRLFHYRGVDQSDPPSQGEVAPDSIARRLFIDLGLKASRAAV